MAMSDGTRHETMEEEDDDGRAVTAATAGTFVGACRIDLPPNDVVEEIEFERFFRLNLTFGSLHESAGFNLTHLALRENAGGDQAPSPIDVGALPVALYMPFTQQWQLDGYNRGRLVNSFTLAPGEEQTVELFTWDRVRSSFESSTSFDTEQSTESSGTRRDVTDIANDVSRQSGLEMNTGGKVGFTVDVVKVDLSGGMSARTAVNDAEKNTRNTIVEATTRSTNHVRTSRTLKVSESRESGHEERVTRRLRNANQCHTLTIPFFEVLANYWVRTFLRTADVRLVVLIGSAALSKLTGFTRETVRVHETTINLALLDRALAPGFDAARFLDARDRACAILCSGCSCGDETFSTTSQEWDAVVVAARAIAQAVNKLRTRTVIFPASVFLAVPVAAGGGGVSPDVISDAIADIKRHLFDEALADQAPRLLIDLASVGIGSGATAPVSPSQAQALHNVLTGLPPQALANLHADPGLADHVGWEIYGAVLLFHPELISAGVIAGAIRASAGGLTSYDDEGLVAAMANFGPAYDAWIQRQAADAKDAANRAELARIANEERSLRVLEAFGLRESADAQERLDALLNHLNDPRNIDHYRFAVWNERSGSTDDQILALALAGLVDPTAVGVVGDQLAVPIRIEDEARWAAFFADSIADLVDHTTVDQQRHILPTAALYAEAIPGQCCACEANIVRTEELAIDQASLQNDLLREEKARLQARLAAKPPLLDRDPPCKCCAYLVACGCGCSKSRSAGTDNAHDGGTETGGSTDTTTDPVPAG
jgi:radical SAM protein with 4Fe4S-binding SPASM domain